MRGPSANRPDVSVDIVGLHLSNPTILASGVLGSSLKILQRAVRSGAGAVVSPSIGVRASEGFRAPSMVKVDCGYISAMGLANPGMDVFATELRRMVKDFPVIVSIFGSKPRELERIVSMMENTPAKAYELNLSSPELTSQRADIQERTEYISDLVRAVRIKTKRPLIVKVSAEMPTKVARVAYDNGADAITAINSVSAMAIDTETGYPILSRNVGGLSGSAIKPIAVKCVYDITKSLDVPVIGCGGISSWDDAMEFFYAGASAVQIGSAIERKGLRVFREIVGGIRNYLTSAKYKSLKEIVGLAQRR